MAIAISIRKESAVGKASRRKAESRIVRQQSRRIREGQHADRRGALVAPTIAGYETAATSNTDGVREALVARHNRRMIRLMDERRVDQSSMRAVVAPLGHARHALVLLGADANRPPPHFGSTWADHLSWGIDSVLAAARLLFAGQIIGASIIIRQQLERWTENLAYNAKIRYTPGETRADFIQRVWDLDESVEIAEARSRRGAQFGAPLIPWTGRRAGAVFGELSELAHGRGRYVAVARWDAGDLLGTPANPAIERTVKAAHRLIVEATALVVRRLRMCIATLAFEAGRTAEERLVLHVSDAIPAGGTSPESWSLWPLVPSTGLSDGVRRKLEAMSLIYSRAMTGDRPAERLFFDFEMFDLFFYSMRFRAVEAALHAFEVEKTYSDGELDLGYLNAREYLYVFASEAAGLLSRWAGVVEVSNAAAVAASSLRSAYWLWLEDDDRAMAMLRITLEQTARIRCWRMKPEKAAALESNANNTPRDWLEECGLRRLKALNLALGEMSHFRPNSKWIGARNLIIDLQPESDRPKDPEFTGRGDVLNRLSILLLRECAEYVRATSGTVADSFHGLLRPFGEASKEAQKSFDRYLQHVWSRRNASLGKPELHGPATEYRQLWDIFGRASEAPSSAHQSWMWSLSIRDGS